MYTLPQLQGILYTKDDSVVMGIVSLTLVRCDLTVLPDLNAVLMSKSPHHSLEYSHSILLCME